jgi:hypothetical protein
MTAHNNTPWPREMVLYLETFIEWIPFRGYHVLNNLTCRDIATRMNAVFTRKVTKSAVHGKLTRLAYNHTDRAAARATTQADRAARARGSR